MRGTKISVVVVDEDAGVVPINHRERPSRDKRVARVLLPIALAELHIMLREAVRFVKLDLVGVVHFKAVISDIDALVAGNVVIVQCFGIWTRRCWVEVPHSNSRRFGEKKCCICCFFPEAPPPLDVLYGFGFLATSAKELDVPAFCTHPLVVISNEH